MNWAEITKKQVEDKTLVVNNEKNKNTEIISNKPEIIDYSSNDMFDFYYAYDMIELLQEMEDFTKINSYNILDKRNKNICNDFIEIIKKNIFIDNIPEYIEWVDKEDEINDDDDQFSDENYFYK